MDTTPYYLLAVLKDELTAFLTSASLNDSIVVDGNKYNDKGCGDFTGFYDWLRDSEERVIGIRYYPFEDVDFLFEVIRSFEYIEIAADNNSFNIYFSDERHIDESKSDDQSFGDNKVYKSESGEYLISFNATGVKELFSYNSALYGSMLLTNLLADKI